MLDSTEIRLPKSGVKPFRLSSWIARWFWLINRRPPEPVWRYVRILPDPNLGD
jgi:hypothetical protein